jgi:hypothetical protein
MSFLGVQAQVVCYEEIKQPHVLELSFSPGRRKSEGVIGVATGVHRIRCVPDCITARGGPGKEVIRQRAMSQRILFESGVKCIHKNDERNSSKRVALSD